MVFYFVCVSFTEWMTTLARVRKYWQPCQEGWTGTSGSLAQLLPSLFLLLSWSCTSNWRTSHCYCALFFCPFVGFLNFSFCRILPLLISSSVPSCENFRLWLIKIWNWFFFCVLFVIKNPMGWYKKWVGFM